MAMMMFMWMTVYCSIGVSAASVFNDNGLDSANFRTAAEEIKAVEIIRMKSRLKGLLEQDQDPKGKLSSANPTGRGVVRVRRSLEPLLENEEGNSTDTSTQLDTTISEMSYIMKIDPRDRRSEALEFLKKGSWERMLKRGAERYSLDGDGSTLKPTVLKKQRGSVMLASAEKSFSTTVLSGNTESTKVVDNLTESSNATAASTVNGTIVDKNGKRGRYTFPPGFSRHRNFSHEDPIKEEPDDPKTEGENVAKTGAEESHTPKGRRLGDDTEALMRLEKLLENEEGNSTDTSTKLVKTSSEMTNIMKIDPEARLSKALEFLEKGSRETLLKRGVERYSLDGSGKKPIALKKHAVHRGSIMLASAEKNLPTTVLNGNTESTKVVDNFTDSSTTTAASTVKGDIFDTTGKQGHYTFPPGFFRHRNFFREEPIVEEPDNPKTEGENAAKTGAEESHTPEGRKLGDNTEAFGDIDSFKVFNQGQEEPENELFSQEEQIVVEVPVKSLSTQQMTPLAWLMTLITAALTP